MPALTGALLPACRPAGPGRCAEDASGPLGARGGGAVAVAAAALCAACGLVYELALVAVAAARFPDTVTQTSLVLSAMVFAMGAGSFATRYVQRAAVAFALVEGLLALAGGLSVPLVGFGADTVGLGRAAPFLVAVVVGTLVGTEIPLLLAVVQRAGAGDLRGAATDLLTADYVGALLGGLAFPFLLVPWAGAARAAMVAGACNALAGLVVLARAGSPPRPVRRGAAAVTVAVVAVLTAACCTTDGTGRPHAQHGCTQAAAAPAPRLAAVGGAGGTGPVAGARGRVEP